MAEALAPSFGLDTAAAARAAADVRRVLAMPELERARRAPHAWRELKLWFPEGGELLKGTVDLVFEEDGQLVVVDYQDRPGGRGGPAGAGRPPRRAVAAVRPRPGPGQRPGRARAAGGLHRPGAGRTRLRRSWGRAGA